MSKKKKNPVVNNPVAKHMETFNKPKTFVDQKKEAKNGKVKHKGRDFTSF
jgi:hypothetical protein